MNSDGPDYARYSLAELEDVLANIDKTRFPERYARAKSLYDEKCSALSSDVDNDSPANDESPVNKPKWSELHPYTRVVMGAFLVTLAGSIIGFSFDFMAAKAWTSHTALPIWISGLSLVGLWFAALAHDHKFARHLASSVRGKLAIAIMPFVFLMFNYAFIEQSTPLALHVIATKTDIVEETMRFAKKDGTKHCRHRIEVLASTELESTDLCLSQAQRDRLPQKGQVTIRGKRSVFGFMIDGFSFKPPR